LVVATVLTAFGFTGTARLTLAVSQIEPISESTVEAIYSLFVLLILVVTILGLIYRFDERAVRHYQAVETLTEFIRDYDDAGALSRDGHTLFTRGDLRTAAVRYQGILRTLPPNTDKQYLKAKQAEREKREARMAAVGASLTWIDAGEKRSVEANLGRQLAALVSDAHRRPVLAAVRDELGRDFWVTGGVIREAVWDHLHGFLLPTPTEDVDVIFYDASDLSKETERGYRARLSSISANVRWSVKNEARMHLVSGDAPYGSLERAVGQFPELATCVAVRLDEDDQVHVLAPHGLADLFNLIVRPVPGADGAAFERRLGKKRWTATWPQLRVERSGESPGELEARASDIPSVIEPKSGLLKRLAKVLRPSPT